jgi:hypothetical protein
VGGAVGVCTCDNQRLGVGDGRGEGTKLIPSVKQGYCCIAARTLI